MADGARVQTEHFDVLIVGAGLSGVGAAHHLQKKCPGKRYAILEGRDCIGGTWDLFRYPGVRSDSDMYTLGYGFRPWREAKAIADGPSILNYVNETADAYDIRKHIRFNHWVSDVRWSSPRAQWTVTAKTNGEARTLTCDFLLMCSGYYRYAEGYTPDFKGVETFRGLIIHPQKWPEDLDYRAKRVVVIGSGATAVTLIPSMANEAAHVTMLQRSPTYMFSMPGTSPLARFLQKVMPRKLAYWCMRWQRIIMQQVMFKLIRARPEKTAEDLIEHAKERLPEGFDVDRHFRPSYKPWDQRLCLVPDDDLFEAISSGKASVVTDHIDRFVEDGVRLKSGETLKADIIVTATGLALEVAGGADIFVDGEKRRLADSLTYKGIMFSGVPNFASIFGYTNASWTLRADLASEYVCRLINHMDAHGYASVVPVNDDPDMAIEPFLDFSSGYVKRAYDILPKQGARAPWRHPQNYFADMVRLRFGKIEDGRLQFERPRPARIEDAPRLAAE